MTAHGVFPPHGAAAESRGGRGFWLLAGSSIVILFAVEEAIHHQAGGAAGPLWKGLWRALTSIAIEDAGYGIQLGGFAFLASAAERRRLFAGLLLVLAFGIASFFWHSTPSMDEPMSSCAYLAGTFVASAWVAATPISWAWRSFVWLLFGAVGWTLVSTGRHDAADAVFAIGVGWIAFRASRSPWLRWLDGSRPGRRVVHEIRNLANLHLRSSPARWDRMYRAGSWEFLRSPSQRSRHYVISGLLRDALVPGSRILDVGCGYGTLHEGLRGQGFRYVGIDVSEAAIRECRSRFESDPDCRFEVSDLEAIADSPPFDAVVLNEVLYYLPPASFDHTIAKLGACLRLEGWLIVSMHRNPVADRLWSRLDRELRPEIAIQTRNPESGSLWTIKSYRWRRERSAARGHRTEESERE